MSVRVIVLAAGKGTRMRSVLPKVLHVAAGRPLVGWVLDAVAGVEPDETVAVVGHGAEAVEAALPAGVTTVVQEEQLGTGHAASVGLEALGDVDGDQILIVPGDSPLLTSPTLAALLEAHAAGDHPVTLLTAVMGDPTGYGRVLRSDAGVTGIVEERDATPEQRALQEVAVSTYVFEGSALAGALGEMVAANDQGELYLTDAVGLLAGRGGAGSASVEDPTEVVGVNSHDQLAAAARLLRERINLGLMEAGVKMDDPARVYVDAGVEVEAGARLYPGVHLEGATTVAAGAEVGPDTFVADGVIGPGARVWYSVLRGVEVGPRAEVGPYASLRPGTVMAEGTKAGTFVEMKATALGAGSKVPHLSYIGDSTIGAGSNIGAGTITCNYDGFAKHHTIIGDGVFIGSDTMLVAPVEVGDGAVTGAGSVITKDVSPGSLAVERSSQREIPGYAERRARMAESEGD